jgi:hypothetical protein
MPRNKIGMSIAALIAAGAIGVGGAALANASATTSAATTGVTALSSDSSTTGSPHTNPQPGQAPTDRTGGPGGAAGAVAPHQHTDVTGDELAKVTAAVQAKDSAATVQSVQKDPDGSYDVHAMKAGQPVMYEVSADLNTISEGPQGGPGAGGPGGPVGPAAPAPTGSAPTGSAQS